VLLVTLVAVALAAAGEAIVGVDEGVAASLHSNASPAATAFVQLVTQLGSTAVLLAVTAVAAGYLARLGRRADAAFLVLAFAGAEALTWSLKALFQRERPSFDEPIATASSFSFPSGHALVSLAVYGALAYVLLDGVRSRRARSACVAGAALMVAAIGFSRLYLGVHYLSDVLAGFAVAVAWLLLIATVRQWHPVVSISWARPAAARAVRSSTLVIATVLVLAVPTACGSDDDSAGPELPRGSEPVELDPADFVERIDNPYWPMAPGSRWVYRETDDEGGEQRVEVTVTAGAKKILGIDATVVRDVVSEDGEVVEDTFDWYAQDKWGNVWYLGEDTKEYENGKVVTTDGSWEAGVDGAQAGIVMPGELEVGQAYRQEYYEGEAEDNGEILSLDATTKVPAGSYDAVVKTEDTNALEPGVLEHKYYAEGVGPVLAVAVSGGSREELLRFESGD
jgi:membrane-associated phospholipid phosphatase